MRLRGRLNGKFSFPSIKGAPILVQMLACLLLGLAFGSAIILLDRQNPFEIYSNLINRAFFTRLGIMIAIQRATPYILASSAAVLAFQGGAINMGLDGQFLVGASIAGIAGYGLPPMPAMVKIPLVLCLCAAGGAAAAFIPAAFKRLSGVNEVITGMIANLLMPFLIRSIVFASAFLRSAQQGAATHGITETARLSHFADLSLGGLGAGTKANTAIFIAIAMALFLTLWMRRSRLGYEIRMTRASYTVAEFAGIRASRTFFISMMMSGAIAGIAGATEILGVWHKYTLGTLAVGNKGLVIALVGGQSFIGSAVASLLYGGLESGAMSASWSTSTPRPLIDILVLLLFLFAALPGMRQFFIGGKRDDKENLGGSFLVRRRSP